MYICKYQIARNFRWVQIFVIFADRPASAWPSTGRGVVRASYIHSMKKEKRKKKISEGSGGISAKFCTIENYMVYDSTSIIVTYLNILGMGPN